MRQLDGLKTNLQRNTHRIPVGRGLPRQPIKQPNYTMSQSDGLKANLQKTLNSLPVGRGLPRQIPQIT